MGIWLSSELRKVNGGEEKEWRPTLGTPVPGTSRLFNNHFLRRPVLAIGQPYLTVPEKNNSLYSKM